jgi:hypothetical protein
VRFSRIAPAFYPFLICIWLGCLNEIISIVLAYMGYFTMVNNNIYVLAESMLIVFQLVKWGALGKFYRAGIWIMVLMLCIWLAENVFVFSLNGLSSYYRLFYSVVIVLLSIQVNNRLILTEKKLLIKNSMFLVCLGFIFYFTYKILAEIFWLYGLKASPGFRENVFSIMVWINFLVNLIYAFAVLWMPAKQRFTMQY